MSIILIPWIAIKIDYIKAKWLKMKQDGARAAKASVKYMSGNIRVEEGKVLFQREEHPVLPAPYSIRTTKKIYSAPDKEMAIAFLSKQNVTEPFYYIEVDTPSGRFGIDNGGRIYDNKRRFIEAEPEPEKLEYDEKTQKVEVQIEDAMKEKRRQVPPEVLQEGESYLRCLRVIIEDEAADFYLRRMSVRWGSQFKNASFNAFLEKRFVEGKDRTKLYQKTESSQNERARAEEGLHVAAADVLSGQWKP